MGTRNNENVGLAFALVVAAGSATGIGGSVVFFPSLVRLASRKTLAGALGLSAGIMTFVSFVEIFIKSQTFFEDAGSTNDDAIIYSILCFFVGVVFMLLLNACVTHLLSGGQHAPQRPGGARQQNATTDNGDGDDDDDDSSGVSDDSESFAPCPCHDENPIRTLEKLEGMAESMLRHPDHAHPEHAVHRGQTSENPHHHQHHNNEGSAQQQAPDGYVDPPPPITYIMGGASGTTEEAAIAAEAANMEDQTSVGEHSVTGDNPRSNPNGNGTGDGVTRAMGRPVSEQNPTIRKPPSQTYDEEALIVPVEGDCVDEVSPVQDEDEKNEEDETERNKSLMRMSFNTALAIGLHNFPEGLATFVASLEDPKIGAFLAIAIGIHNIPEGLCVAMPIYYATGNKWSAFGWSILSGAAEPFAALLGWLILDQFFSDEIYALLFGITSGMMVVISIRELLPTAHRYDPEDSIVTYCFVAGMAVMALSLVLFLV